MNDLFRISGVHIDYSFIKEVTKCNQACEGPCECDECTCCTVCSLLCECPMATKDLDKKVREILGFGDASYW